MEKLKNLLLPLSIKQFILANLGMSILIMLFFIHGATSGYKTFLIGTVWAFTICITQWFGALFMNYLIDKKIKWIKQPIFRSVVGILAIVSNSVIVFALVQFIMLYVLYGTLPIAAWSMVSKSIIFTLLY